MPSFTPYFGMVAALLFGALIVAFAGTVTIVPTPVPHFPIASSTLSVISNIPLPSLTIPTLVSPEAPSATTATTTTVVATSTPPSIPEKEKKLPVKIAQTVAPHIATSTVTVAAPVPVPVPTPAPLPPSGNISLDTTASNLRGALVNIMCYVPPGSGLHSISGSGVLIDSKGIILTNAHIAQYFLLFDRGVTCTIRTGSPAADSYEAALLYISPAWVHANATVLTQAQPTGTGEYDFAFLAITKSETKTPLPSSFNSISLATLPPASGTPIVIASYGAQFLAANQVQSSLYPTIVFGSVKDIFTFAINTIDVLALGGSAAAQEGSSGGGIADATGALVGTITTSTVEGDTSTRSLDAITASYIRSEYAREMGIPLDSLFGEPTIASLADFAPKIPFLESIITAHL